MEEFVTYLIEHGISISTMESCTSGLLASAITDTEGASAIFKGGFVTYSNEAKIRQGVPAEVIGTFGVYSPQTAEAMAEACRMAYQAQIGVGVTGTTGNMDPSNADSVPGEVFYAVLWGEEKRNCRLELATRGRSRHELKRDIVRAVSETLREMMWQRRSAAETA